LKTIHFFLITIIFLIQYASLLKTSTEESCDQEHQNKEFCEMIDSLRIQNAELYSRVHQLSDENNMLKLECGEVNNMVDALKYAEAKVFFIHVPHFFLFPPHNRVLNKTQVSCEKHEILTEELNIKHDVEQLLDEKERLVAENAVLLRNIRNLKDRVMNLENELAEAHEEDETLTQRLSHARVHCAQVEKENARLCLLMEEHPTQRTD
jgi:cell division septum initiation protein DivIVA